MSDLSIIQGPAPTMTSKEMAALTEKRHDNVKRTIETLASQGVISQPQIEDGPKAANGVIEKHYLVGKRDSYIIVAQLSPEFTARLVDRWQALEAKQAAPANLSRMDILKLAMESEQGRLEAESRLAIAAPKAAALDLLAASEDAVTVREAAKLLGIKVERLTTWMHAHGWVYRLNGRWVAYQQHIANGRLEFKEANYSDPGTGQMVHAPYCHILPKGLAKLAEHFQIKEAA